MFTRSDRLAYLTYTLHMLMLPGESVPAFLDSVLDAMPDLIEDRTKLSQPVAVIRSYGHLDEYMEITRQSEDDAAKRAQEQLNKKRFEFSKVEMAFEQLREAIRAYHREVKI
jgi:chorismate mutase